MAGNLNLSKFETLLNPELFQILFMKLHVWFIDSQEGSLKTELLASNRW